MKMINLIALTALLLVGCDKSDDIYEEIVFGVTLSGSNSYYVGEEVTFEFSGNAGYIIFYTGEDGACYENEDGSIGTSLDIKSLTTDLESYSYTYSQVGHYTATFLATSASIYGSSQKAKSVSFEITELPTDPDDPDDTTTGSGSLEDAEGSNDDSFPEVTPNDPDDTTTGSGSLEEIGGSNDDIFPEVTPDPTHDSSLSDITGSNTDIFTE